MILDNQKPLKEKTSISLDSDLIVKIRELAEQDERSFSQYINRVLRSHVAQIDEEKAKNMKL